MEKTVLVVIPTEERHKEKLERAGKGCRFVYASPQTCLLYTSGSLSSLPYMIFAQVVFGLAIGAAAASLGILLLKKGTMQAAGMDMILVIALVMIAFGLSEAIGGNAFLTVYLMGILLGNSNIREMCIRDSLSTGQC